MRRLFLLVTLLGLVACTQAALSQQAVAGQASQTFADPSLEISFDYPASLVSDTSASPDEATKRCMAVLLTVRTKEATSRTQASLSLLEFKRSCVTDAQWQDHDRMLTSLTKALYTQPGAQSIGQPLVYDYGGDLTAQRVHMSAVRQQTHDDQGQPRQLLQMDVATFVHDRAILWVIQSSSLEEFNRLSKTAVSFDGKRKVPLFPASIQPGSAPAPVAHP